MEIVTASHVLHLLAEIAPFGAVKIKGDKISLYVYKSDIEPLHAALAKMVKDLPHFEVVFDTKPLKECNPGNPRYTFSGAVKFAFTVIEQDT